MARPLKEGVDYFSLDCYMDDKIKMIQAEFGLKGFAIVVKLWQTIYREHGYYCEWNEEKKLLFASEEGADCVSGEIFFQKSSLINTRSLRPEEYKNGTCRSPQNGRKLK